MSLFLHPRAAPGDRLRVWVGVFGRSHVPELRWTLDGVTADPQVVSPLAPARPGDLAEPDEAQAFTGVFEWDRGPGGPIEPGSRHRLTVTTADGVETPARLEMRSLPVAIPSGIGRSFRVLLVSCFHRAEDKEARLARWAHSLSEHQRPDLTLLMGDQVYLDLPTLNNFPDNARELARRFERDYRDNWTLPGYADLLRLAPSVAIPDDHEFWNNYPHRSSFIQNSWKEESRERWRRAATALYQAFQLAHPASLAEPLTFDVEPLSFLLLDNRSRRAEDRSRSLAPKTIEKIDRWVDRVIAERRYGVVVTGQSLFDPPVGDLQGKIADWVLANYGDYPPLIERFVRLAEAGRPVLCLTGDVHWGRVLVARGHGGAPRFYEIISSPSSLVTTVGSDQLSSLGQSFRALFGRPRDPFHRHSDTREPSETVTWGGSRYGLERLFPETSLKGDQVTMLTFRRRGEALELAMRYWSLPPGGSATPRDFGPIRLTQRL